MTPASPNSPASPALQPIDAGLSALFALASAAAYIRTLYPSVLPSDGAEFQTLAALLGIAHTTGYGVYLLLAKLVTFLPVGDIAYRVNLFSALMGGLTIGLVYLLGVLVTRSRWGAAIAAVSMALAGTFWSQAVIAEVYTPASAVLAGVLVLLLSWYRTRKNRFLFLAGLLGGLSLGVHASVGLAAPAVAVLILVSRPFKLRSVGAAMGGALLGVVLMISAFFAIDANPAPYNIFDAAYRPAISAWDRSATDIATPLQRFIFEITAVQWRPAMFSDPLKVMPEKASLFTQTLPKDYALPVLALMLIGAVYILMRDWRLGIFILLALLAHNLYTFNYNIGDNYVFYIPGYVYLAMLSASGVAGLLALLRRLVGQNIRLGRLSTLGAGLLLLFLAVQPFYQSRLEMLKSGQAAFDFTGLPTPAETLAWYRNIRATAAAMEPNAIGYIGWDDMYAYTYAAWVDLGRSDLRFIEPTPYSQKGGMATSMLVFIRSNLDQRPQYFSSRIDRVVSVGIRLQAVDVGPTRLFRVASNK